MNSRCRNADCAPCTALPPHHTTPHRIAPRILRFRFSASIPLVRSTWLWPETRKISGHSFATKPMQTAKHSVVQKYSLHERRRMSSTPCMVSSNSQCMASLSSAPTLLAQPNRTWHVSFLPTRTHMDSSRRLDGTLHTRRRLIGPPRASMVGRHPTLGHAWDGDGTHAYSQVVAGTNHRIALSVGGRSASCVIFEPLPHTGNPPMVTEAVWAQ
jgi:hypothetical protein